MQAPTAILRFTLPRATLWQRLTLAGFARFTAGDLIGVLPQGGSVPRLYSLASGRRDGARVLVWGGGDKAACVADTLEEILASSGFTPSVPKAEGRCVEDVS